LSDITYVEQANVENVDEMASISVFSYVCVCVCIEAMYNPKLCAVPQNSNVAYIGGG